MTAPAALVLTASTLHHDEGRTSDQVLDRQVEQLRSLGHDPVVLLGEGSARTPGAVAARTAEDAERWLDGVERVTVLGHGVAAARPTVARVMDAPVLATRTASEGWERIDAEEDWAGLMSCSGELVRHTLRGLGDWDAQATLLRRAVQAGVPRLRLPDNATGHVLDERDWRRLERDERDARLIGQPTMLTPAVQAGVRRAALALDRRWPRSGLWSMAALLALCLVVVTAALVDARVVAAIGLVATPPLAGLCVALARLDGRLAWPPALVTLAVLLAVPLLLSWGGAVFGLVVGGAATAQLAAAVAAASPRNSPSWLRLDSVGALLACSLVVVDPLFATMLATGVILAATLSGPSVRRRLRAEVGRWGI